MLRQDVSIIAHHVALTRAKHNKLMNLQATESQLTLFSVRGRVHKKLTIMPTAVNTIVHVP